MAVEFTLFSQEGGAYDTATWWSKSVSDDHHASSEQLRVLLGLAAVRWLYIGHSRAGVLQVFYLALPTMDSSKSPPAGNTFQPTTDGPSGYEDVAEAFKSLHISLNSPSNNVGASGSSGADSR